MRIRELTRVAVIGLVVVGAAATPLTMTGCGLFGGDNKENIVRPPPPPPVCRPTLQLRTVHPDDDRDIPLSQSGPGDSDYKNHGIYVEIAAVASVSLDRMAVVIRLDYSMTEDRPDHTRGLGFSYAYAESDGRISRILSPTQCSGKALVRGHEEHRLPLGPANGPVAEVFFLGDGNGGDFDGDGSLITRVKYNTIRFEVEVPCEDMLTVSSPSDTIVADFPGERVLLSRLTRKVLATIPN